MKTKVVVVIPNWNGADFIADSIASLEKQTLKPHIIVVDNGSVDDSIEIISKFKGVELVKLPENTGFDGGVNAGIKKAFESDYEYITLFNNDALAEKTWVERLVDAADNHPEAGIITGKFKKMDKKHIDSTGDFYTTIAMPFPRGRNQEDKGQYDTAEYVFGATGGATMYRVSMLQVIGIFDEKFFAYLEDVDISFRAQIAGWKVWYEPKAVAYHLIGGTSSKLGNFTRYHYIKNFYMLYAKNMPGKLYFKYLFNFILQALRLFASSLLKGRGWAYIQGAARAFINIPHVLRERGKIQKSRTVEVGYIDDLLYKGRPPKIPKLPS